MTQKMTLGQLKDLTDEAIEDLGRTAPVDIVMCIRTELGIKGYITDIIIRDRRLRIRVKDDIIEDPSTKKICMLSSDGEHDWRDYRSGPDVLVNEKVCNNCLIIVPITK